jgi:hypothetical protein
MELGPPRFVILMPAVGSGSEYATALAPGAAFAVRVGAERSIPGESGIQAGAGDRHEQDARERGDVRLQDDLPVFAPQRIERRAGASTAPLEGI